MKNLIRILIPLLIIAGIVTAYMIYRYYRNNGPRNRLILSGNIEVKVIELSFRAPGFLLSRSVSEGDKVTSGQEIATLEDSEYQKEILLREADVDFTTSVLAELKAGSRKQEIEKAEAGLAQAKARLAELKAGFREEEVRAAEAGLDRAKSHAVQAALEYDRIKKLFEDKVVSQSLFEAVNSAYVTAGAQVRESEEKLTLLKSGSRKEQIEQAEAAVIQYEKTLELLRIGPREETIKQAEARLKQAKAALELAKTRLSYTRILSPSNGFVLSEGSEQGEYVSPGMAVVTIGDLSDVWLRAFIDESDLGRIKLGQKVNVTTDTFPGKVYEGNLSFISSEAEFTPKNVQTQKERVKLVYRVKIDISNRDMELKPGMPADAEILVEN